MQALYFSPCWCTFLSRSEVPKFPSPNMLYIPSCFCLGEGEILGCGSIDIRNGVKRDGRDGGEGPKVWSEGI